MKKIKCDNCNRHLCVSDCMPHERQVFLCSKCKIEIPNIKLSSTVNKRDLKFIKSHISLDDLIV